MPKYRNAHTGIECEMSEAQYEQIKSAGNFIPVKPQPEKAAKPKRGRPKKGVTEIDVSTTD